MVTARGFRLVPMAGWLIEGVPGGVGTVIVWHRHGVALPEARRMRRNAELKAKREAELKRQEAEQPLYMSIYRSSASYMSKGTRLFQTGMVAAACLVAIALAQLAHTATTGINESQAKVDQLMEKAGNWMDNSQSVDPAFMQNYMSQKLFLEQQKNEHLRTTHEQKRWLGR